MADNNMGKIKAGCATKGTAAWNASQEGKKEGISLKAPTGQKVADGYDGGNTSSPSISGNKITVSTPVY